MTVLHQIETTPSTWTASGELTAAPARDAANDNAGGYVDGYLNGEVGAYPVTPTWRAPPSVYPCLARGAPGDTRPKVWTPEDYAKSDAEWLAAMEERVAPIVNEYHDMVAARITPRADLPPVIAISGAAGSGKSTVSDYLATLGYTKTKFAKPLKDMMRAIGFGEDDIEGCDKELSNHLLCDKTPRHAMQTLGTEWGRKCIGDDFWVNLWRDDASRHPLVVVDDCRFPNEAAAVRKMGGRVLRLVGRGGLAGSHASEAHDFIADEVIVNSGSILDLQERVADVIEGWRV